MRKNKIIILSILFVGLGFINYGQDLNQLKSSLEKLKIEKNGSYESDKWYYNPDIADIQKIENETLNKILTGYNLFNVFLEGYYGYHEKSSRCLVLLNSENSSLTIIDPLWYNGISSEFIEMFIDYKFESKEELQKFIFELQNLLLIGSEHNKSFKNTVFDEHKITFDLYDSSKEESLWRNIEIRIENNTMKSLSSTNPVDKE